ncbi:hypothetical protein CNECB9_3430026 [Cupriavidus necator]|uniref:HTH marR-type domain-containing protein n=1 Tax=Cupriavidus necator TaxID=106590 RepID=A0A1K0IUS7_CUPNE|nr:hypothetical protein CNECB9_3430026 [Cupriavidus necator]
MDTSLHGHDRPRARWAASARLEAGGLVERKIANEDARSSELYLTEAGQKLRKKIDRFATDQVSNALRRMVPADQQALVRSLARYADALTQDNSVKTAPGDAVAARILEGYQQWCPGGSPRSQDEEARVIPGSITEPNRAAAPRYSYR